MKVVSLVRAPANEDAAQFRQWYLLEFAPAILRRQPLITGLAVNLIDGAEALYPAARANRTADVYAEFWLAGSPRLPAADFSCPTAQEEMYEVEEIVELDRRPPGLGRTPGVKVFSGMCPVENVSPAQTRAYWDAHVPLALRVHIGMNNYTREWIEEPLSKLGSPYFGIASLHFPTIADMRDRFFDSPQSIPIHAADVQRFVGSASPLIATRYLLK